MIQKTMTQQLNNNEELQGSSEKKETQAFSEHITQKSHVHRATPRALQWLLVGTLSLTLIGFGGQLWAVSQEEARAADLEKQLDAYLQQDTDQDGLLNREELEHGTNMTSPDTDKDGVSDGIEVQQGRNPLNKADGRKTLR